LRILIDDHQLCFLRVQSECRWFWQNEFFMSGHLFLMDGSFDPGGSQTLASLSLTDGPANSSLPLWLPLSTMNVLQAQKWFELQYLGGVRSQGLSPCCSSTNPDLSYGSNNYLLTKECLLEIHYSREKPPTTPSCFAGEKGKLTSWVLHIIFDPCLVRSSQPPHLVWKISPKNPKFFFFSIRVQKKSHQVESKNTWVKDGSASYFVWVKSMFGSVRVRAITWWFLPCEYQIFLSMHFMLMEINTISILLGLIFYTHTLQSQLDLHSP